LIDKINENSVNEIPDVEMKEPVKRKELFSKTKDGKKKYVGIGKGEEVKNVDEEKALATESSKMIERTEVYQQMKKQKA